MAQQVELIGVQIANLRGFRDARLDLSPELTLLVGPNNSGKTSVLRLLDWALNQVSEETALGAAPLTAEELRLLMPARETRNAARRLVLLIRILDGRRRTRFKCEGDIAHLRIGLRMPGVLRLNVGPPRRNEASDRNAALDLFREIRADVAFSLVPATRNAQSRSFQAALRDAVLSKLEERAVHAGRRGAPAEYRKIKKALESILSITDELVLPLWDDMREALPPGLASSATVGADLDPAALVSWIADQVELRITTGDHDRATVPPEEVGSGLQSLLELALQQARPAPSDVDRIIAVEEPEAFLHPAAQRTLARLIADDGQGRRIVSTHSPILVDEAKYGETVLVRSHRFFSPREVSDQTREKINTALLVGHGAEMAFASSVLLVEGGGDRAFYETLRRRLARASADGRLDHLAIVPVGSKSAFAPWLQILVNYGEAGDRPIKWLIAADGDAATQVRQAYANAGIRLPGSVRSALFAAANARGAQDRADFVAATQEINRVTNSEGVGLHLSPVDLEYAALSGCSDERASALADELELVATTRAELETALRNRKAAFRRADLASRLAWDDVSADTRDVLFRWTRTVMSSAEARRIVRDGD